MFKKIVFLSVFALFISCNKIDPNPIGTLTLQQTRQQIDPSETQQILFTLAADSMKGRESKNGGYFKAAQFVTDYFKAHNIAPFYSNYQDTLSTKGVKTYNVVGRIGNYDPQKKTILIGAHLDHVGIRGSEGDTIYNGANDNATGSTAVMQLGKFLAQFDWDQNIILALFADEEKGLRGAYHLAERMKEENVALEYMINFEMIGKTLTTGANQVYMTGYNYSNMPKVMNTISPNFVQFLPEAKELNLFKRSDNYAFFKELKIPAFTLSSFDFKNFDYYHKAGDEAEKIEVENMNQIICTAAFTIAKLLHQKNKISLTSKEE
jgi:Zn-dependent M28 family amino/carboxypeptidase